MATASCSDEEFRALFKEHGATETARRLGVSERNVYKRRRNIEEAAQTRIAAPSSRVEELESMYPRRVPLTIDDGVVLIGSDAHYWPDRVSTAHRAFCRLLKDLKPKVAILNGDVFDGASISRHAPIGWAQTPTVRQELDAVDDRLHEIRKAAGETCELFWTLGNHDMRMENRLSDRAPEFKDLQGFALKDHFPGWRICLSIWINGHTVVKHRYKGGVHATHNNAVNAGKTMVTGHLHSLKVTPFADYNGTRFGIDTGTLDDPYGPQFDYAEDNPLNHRSGFIVMTFRGGRLLWPEVCRVVDENHVEFRGEVIEV